MGFWRSLFGRDDASSKPVDALPEMVIRDGRGSV